MRVITGREHARQRIELDILGERPVLFCVQRPQAALAQVWLEHTGGAWHSVAQRGPLRGDDNSARVERRGDAGRRGTTSGRRAPRFGLRLGLRLSAYAPAYASRNHSVVKKQVLKSQRKC